MMKLVLIIILFTCFPVTAQFKISLPDSFSVRVNGSVINLSTSWNDSLRHDAEHNTLLYFIDSGDYNVTTKQSLTKIKLPQTLTISQIFRQTILFYRLLANEKQRTKEKLFIYPFFLDTIEPPFIECNYSDATFNFTLHRWETIPRPEEPTPEEKALYNQLMKSALTNTLSFGELPDSVYAEFSVNHNVSIEKIKRIYKKVVLWQVKY